MRMGIDRIREEIRLRRVPAREAARPLPRSPPARSREDEEEGEGRKILYQPVWQNNSGSSSRIRNRKELLRVRHSHIRMEPMEDSEEEIEHLPPIVKYKYSPLRRREPEEESSYRGLTPRSRMRKLWKGYHRSSRAFRSFRKAVHVVLFPIYLRTFNERMRLQRKTIFNKYMKEQLKEKLLEMKRALIEGCRPLFRNIADHYNFDYRPLPNEDPKLKREKVKSTRRLVGVAVEGVQSAVRAMAGRENMAETLYFLCKHGTYSCLYHVNSNEEMNLMCISEQHGYVRADRHLEQSAILSLVFVKMLLYNILLQPEAIELGLTAYLDVAIIHSNIRLVANILYEVLVDLQDELLEKAPSLYTIGNWEKLQHRFNFKLAEPMTLKEGAAQKNELISGLADHKYVKETYSTRAMVDEKAILLASIQSLHSNIVKYH